MGATHLAQAVIPDMLKAGHGFILLTRATPALRGRAGVAPLAIGKAGLRIPGRSLAHEFHLKRIHVVHRHTDTRCGCRIAFPTRLSLPML